MRSRQPKKEIVPVKFKDDAIGYERRLNYIKEIMHKETTFPKPIDYADIDAAVKVFVANELDITDENGRKVPTYSLYSTQRFSEYSQTWEHTDENGNLLMNFKTVSRGNNPKKGENQGSMYNIPGDRHYTMLEKTVLGDNGVEHIEVYSMRQPFAVDLVYKVNFITNTFSLINEFNRKLNKLFKARQCYIRPNGHYIPLIIDSIDDETSYGLEERKFFVQSVSIRALAYIINEDDFKISKFPKYPRLFTEGERKRKKVNVDILEIPKPENKKVEIDITFEPSVSKVEFEIDMDIDVSEIVTDNTYDVRVFVNDVPIYTEKGFTLKNGDLVRVKIKKTDDLKPSEVKFIGIDPNYVYDPDEVPENAADEAVKEEILTVE